MFVQIVRAYNDHNPNYPPEVYHDPTLITADVIDLCGFYRSLSLDVGLLTFLIVTYK